MQSLLEYTDKELIDILAPLDIKGYRVGQIFIALNQGKAFQEMNIPQDIKQ